MWWQHPGIVAAVFTALGAVIIKGIEGWLGRTAEKREDGRDYRGEINELIERLDKLEDEVTFWRQRFYAEQEQTAMLRVLLIQNGVTLPMQTIEPPNAEAPAN